MSPRNVLIVDDVKTNRLILTEILKNEYNVLEAATGEDALKLLESGSTAVSAVLLDISMPGMGGYEVLRRMRENVQTSTLPVIMITGSDDAESRVFSLAQGANDYVTKPYNSEVIRHCLRNQIAFHEAAESVKSLQRDKLTSLYSRETFFDKVREMVAAKDSGYYVMTCFDIEKFKVINDQYGTKKGDKVLVHTATVFREGFEPLGGICCRVSADNFSVLYPASYMDTEQIKAIREHASRVEGLASPVIFCIGRYIVADKSLSPSAMYDRAKLAADSIKGRYDQKIAIYDDSMRSRLIHEQEIVLEMEAALKGGQFEVWYQPQYNYATQARIGAEALVRWRHPEKGLIPPAEFIDIFERNGFIYALDKFVWEEVCRKLRKWMDAGLSPLPVSVNISRYDVFRPDLVAVLTGFITKYRLPIDLLRLEITESAFAESAQHIIDVVKALLKCGFTVEIDDFGSGYSSLNTLKDVPAQILKLDMKFLDSGDDSQRGGNIVESVVRMAKWLGMSVIAEGVETVEQADYLKSIGCNYIQGYLYSRAIPANEYEERVKSGDREEHLLALETVENLDNNAFWDPASMDTLIFNSFVGGACIYEYHNGKIELIRATEKYAQVIGSAGMTIEDALKLNWTEHLDEENRAQVVRDLDESVATKKEVTGEYVFLDLPNCPHETHLRSTMRVIAAAGDRYLVYCTNENITAQRKSEERERIAARQLSAIMQNINGGVTASVIDGESMHRLFANDVYYAQRGYAREEYESRFKDGPGCILPEDYDRVMREVRTLSLEKKSGTVEYRIKRPDGKVRCFKSNISIMDFPGVKEPVQLSVTNDVTERHEAERQVRSISEQMQAVMTNVDLGIIAAVVSDGEARYIFANDRYYDLLGYTRAQFDNEVKSAYDTVAPSDRPRVIEETVRLNSTGKSTVIVYNALRRDGSERVFRATISKGSLTDVDEPVQFTIIRDITEETEIERRERFAAAQVSRLVNDMPGGFARMRINENGSITVAYINEGLTRLFGMSREEIMNMYANDAFTGVHPDDLPIVRDFAANAFAEGEAHSTRYRLLCNKGYIWLTAFGRVSKDISGDTYLNVYYSDATEEAREEEAKKELLDNLPGGAAIYEFKNGELKLNYQNKSCWDLVGLDEDEASNFSSMSVVHPDDVSVIMHELSAAIEQKRDIVCDIRLKHRTLGYRPAHLVGRIVYKAMGGFMVYAVFTLIDPNSVTYQQMLPLLLSVMMESTSDLSFAKDKNFRYMTSSRAFANMVGLDAVDDLVGKTDYDLFVKDIADKFRRDDEMLLSGGKSIVDMIEEIPSNNGIARYSSTSKYILRDGSGAVIGLYGVGRDVTKAVVQDTQLKLVNDSIPGGLATYVIRDGSLHVAYCNDGFCELFGGTREGFEARGDFDPMTWVHEDDRPELTRQIATLVKDDVPMDCAFRIHTLGGDYKWITERTSGAMRRGDTLFFNAILLDITEQQNALEMLRISEEENTLATRLGGSIIMRFTIKDRCLSIAPEIAAANDMEPVIYNVPYEPVRRGLISKETADAYIGFFEAIMKGNRAGSVIYKHRYLEDWRWIEAKSTTIFSGEGEPVKAVIHIQDVTERLEKETIYKRWQQSLNDRTPESYTLFRCNLNKNTTYDTKAGYLISFDIENAGRTFNERAKAYADKCIFDDDRDRYITFINSDALLAGYYRGNRSGFIEYREAVSVDKTRWIRLTVDLVEYPSSTDVEAYLMYEDIDAAKREELQTKALSETDTLTGLLNRAAFTARVDKILASAGPDMRFALLMLDIDGFKQVNDVFGHGAGDKTLIDIADGLSSIVRNEDLVARMGGDEFMVFLYNVRDVGAVEAKARQICAITRRSFSLEVQISGSVGVAFAPRDGVDFETLYKKVDAALYYVKGSGKNNVIVYDKDMADEHLVPEADSIDSDGKKLVEKKRRMLIVDDNRMDHAMLQNIFKNDFIIEKARDGNSALIRLRHYGNAISVVLLDLAMPGMDGFAVLKRMQESAELRSIPVIIVSGDESRDTCLKAIRRGATDFVTKPVDPDILRLRVQSAISKAENEHLRAQNSLLEMQNEERLRYGVVLDRCGMAFIELNWLTGNFSYYPSISQYLLGNYDERGLWRILLSDMVADTKTVQEMQKLVHSVAEDRERTGGNITVRLKTPGKMIHRFRMNAVKVVNDYQLTSKLLISLLDLDYETR